MNSSSLVTAVLCSRLARAADLAWGRGNLGRGGPRRASAAGHGGPPPLGGVVDGLGWVFGAHRQVAVLACPTAGDHESAQRLLAGARIRRAANAPLGRIWRRCTPAGYAVGGLTIGENRMAAGELATPLRSRMWHPARSDLVLLPQVGDVNRSAAPSRQATSRTCRL